MKPSLMYFSLLVLSIFLYDAQGIRLGNLSVSARNNQEFITKSSSSNQDDESAMATDLSSGINRKLMTKIISSTSTATNDKNSIPKVDKKFTYGKTDVVLERYPDIIDLTGMDYSPAKRKPPIHN